MTLKRTPPITRELCEFLERAYPDKAPDPRDSNREVWMKAGRVEVVRRIRQLFEGQSG